MDFAGTIRQVLVGSGLLSPPVVNWLKDVSQKLVTARPNEALIGEEQTRDRGFGSFQNVARKSIEAMRKAQTSNDTGHAERPQEHATHAPASSR